MRKGEPSRSPLEGWLAGDVFGYEKLVDADDVAIGDDGKAAKEQHRGSGLEVEN